MTYRPGELAAASAAFDHEVLEMLVAPSRRRAAAWGARKAAELIGGRVPAVKFFNPCAETGEVEGSATIGGTEIFVRSDLSLEATAGVAAHETVHANGSSDESQCYAMQRQVEADWQRHRHQQREELAKSWETARDRWFAFKTNTPADRDARLEMACAWAGVQPFQADLAVKELDLRTDELESLFAASTSGLAAKGPAGHLQLRAVNPPMPRYSFARGT